MQIPNGITLRVQNQKRGVRALGHVILDPWETEPIFFSDTRELRELLRLQTLNIFRVLDPIPQTVKDLLEISANEEKAPVIDIKSGLVYRDELNLSLGLKADVSLVNALSLKADELAKQINDAKGTFPNLIDKLNSIIAGNITDPSITDPTTDQTAQLQALVDELAIVSGETDANTAEILAARDGFSSLIAKLNAIAGSRLVDEATALELDRLATELETAQTAIGTLTTAVNGLTADVSALQTELTAARGTHVDLTARLEALVVSGSISAETQATIDGLVTDVDAIQLELTAARDGFTSLLEKLNSLGTATDPALQTTVDGVVAELDVARSTYASLDARLQFIQANATVDPKIRTDLDAVVAESAATLAEITAARGTYLDLAARLNALVAGGTDPALQTTVDSLEAEMTAARTTYADLAARLLAIQTAAESSSADPALQGEVDALEVEITAARSTYADLSARLTAIEGSITSGGGVDPALQETVDALELEVTAARGTYESVELRLTAIEAAGVSVETQAAIDASTAHAALMVHADEVHGLRVVDGDLEFYTGETWVQLMKDGLKVGNVSNLTAVSGSGFVNLSWGDPADVVVNDVNGNPVTLAKWKSTKLVRKEVSYPINSNDGEVIAESTVRDQYATTPFEDVGLGNNRTYYYMAFPTTEIGMETVDPANRVSAEPSTGPLPGPQTLLGGDDLEGFYGEMAESELITKADLALALGFTTGTQAFVADTRWLKFIIDGVTIYSSLKPHRHGLSWDALNAANLVYGNRTIVIGGNTYKVRLWRGTENDPAQDADSDQDTRGSEWNRLIMPISAAAPHNETLSTGITKDWGQNYDYNHFGSSGTANGGLAWCQEVVGSNPANRVIRGGGIPLYATNFVQASTLTQNSKGWRPVLELV